MELATWLDEATVEARNAGNGAVALVGPQQIQHPQGAVVNGNQILWAVLLILAIVLIVLLIADRV